MAIAIKPKFEITVADDPAAEAAGMLTPTRFNSGSDLTMATARLLGRVTEGAGEVEELDAAAVKTFLGDATTSAAGLMAAALKTKLDAVGTMANRAVTISASDPSGGADGDVWVKV